MTQQAGPVAEGAPFDEAAAPPRRFKPWEKAFGAVAFLVFLVLLGFVTWRYADQPVTTQVISFSVVSAELTTITVDVTKDPATTAECTVEAQSVSSAQVGVARFTVPPSPDGKHTTRWEVTIPTQEEATTAVVDRCQLAGKR